MHLALTGSGSGLTVKTFDKSSTTGRSVFQQENSEEIKSKKMRLITSWGEMIIDL